MVFPAFTCPGADWHNFTEADRALQDESFVFCLRFYLAVCLDVVFQLCLATRLSRCAFDLWFGAARLRRLRLA